MKYNSDNNDIKLEQNINVDKYAFDNNIYIKKIIK